MSNKIQGGSSTAGLANVDANYQLKVGLETDAVGNAQYVGSVRFQSENDTGDLTGVPFLLAPETDDDYRLRVSQDQILDDELFNYTAQNTGKHTILGAAVNLAPSWTSGGYNTNPTSVLTTTSGATLQTYRPFSMMGTGTLSLDIELAFTGQPNSNSIIDFGLFSGPTSNPFAPTDGAYFRLTSAGLSGICNYNGTETSTGTFPLTEGTGTWAYVTNQKYQFILYAQPRGVEFWVNDGNGALRLGVIPTPAGQGTPYLSSSQPFHIRHAIVGGTAGAAISATLSRYNVRLGGVIGGSLYGELGNRTLGSYQGLSGGTMGSLSSYTNGTNPTAAVPTNTSLAANLPAGLGGQAWETFSLSLTVDGILMSYQVPAGTTAIQGRTLKVTGVKMSAFVQTVLAGGPCNSTFTLNYGHTAVSLATSEAATTKARRVVLLPELTQAITLNQAVNTMIAQPGGCVSMFPEPIFVNPGEFISLAVKHIGTVGTSGTIAYNIQLVYSWE